ncbi:MAG TPA: thiol:disulfide interchange protein DsbG [Steroidobacteraceae bacterium]|jgi:thiol:disulfide interchange protein DsbG|nr:thiol:disulfide interchange protein DsbG [Steroidobacteraceae bacterium]
MGLTIGRFQPCLRIALLILTAVGALPSSALAQVSVRPGRPQAVAAPPGTAPALQTPLQHGFRIIRSFKAVSGLTGWVLQGSDKAYALVYTTADGQTLVTGDLLSSSGENLSDTYNRQFVPAPDLTAVWAKLPKANIVVTGAQLAPKSTLYIVMDPNCIYCHMLWIALQPYEKAGLQVRWIPVGFLHQDSEAKAAALLKGGAAALTQCQQHFDVNTESGGIAGITITPDLHKELAANLQIMQDANIQGTPGLIYKDVAGHVVGQAGMPSLSQLASITGLPPQRETDPQLAQFNR